MISKNLIVVMAMLCGVLTTHAQMKNQNKMIKRNKEAITELIEQGLNEKNSEIALKLAAKNFVDQDAFPNQPSGAEGLKFHFDRLNKAIPDLKVEFRLIAEGSTVVEEWTGTGNLVIDFQTGQPLENPMPITQNGITVFELNDAGLVVERKTFQRGEQ
ncbi:MAG: ester cyclase [Cytophagales bacterium]|nr:ester cyclase [Cytophagales bacterium]